MKARGQRHRPSGGIRRRNSPSASEQIPDKQQGVRQEWQGWLRPRPTTFEQVDLRLWEESRLGVAWGRRGRCPHLTLAARTDDVKVLGSVSGIRAGWMGLFLDRRAAHKGGQGADAEGPRCPLLSQAQPPTSAREKGVHP